MGVALLQVHEMLRGFRAFFDLRGFLDRHPNSLEARRKLHSLARSMVSKKRIHVLNMNESAY